METLLYTLLFIFLSVYEELVQQKSVRFLRVVAEY